MFSKSLNLSDCISLAAVTRFLISNDVSPFRSSDSFSKGTGVTSI
jgi:hypothetical protein